MAPVALGNANRGLTCPRRNALPATRPASPICPRNKTSACSAPTRLIIFAVWAASSSLITSRLLCSPSEFSQRLYGITVAEHPAFNHMQVDAEVDVSVGTHQLLRNVMP